MRESRSLQVCRCWILVLKVSNICKDIQWIISSNTHIHRILEPLVKAQQDSLGIGWTTELQDRAREPVSGEESVCLDGIPSIGAGTMGIFPQESGGGQEIPAEGILG
ncbi:hypothetical protein H920_13206 [Fukomys damarensis]|uniref:Uncharacterized protein n=1 Tax=Fukomys damarensis TaxID=885580 RepID=A0A091D5A1_FUKDA|nr:hypothetical protein H920_13206 [Fukomys damarensis]